MEAGGSGPCGDKPCPEEKKDGVNVKGTGPSAGVNEKGEATVKTAGLNVDVVDKKNDSGQINIEGTLLGGKASGDAKITEKGVTLEGAASATTIGASFSGRIGTEENNFRMGFSVDGPSADANVALTGTTEEVKLGGGAMAQLAKQTVTLGVTINGYGLTLTGTVLEGGIGARAEVGADKSGFSARAAGEFLVGLGFSFEFKKK
jgi:hypothetical protein